MAAGAAAPQPRFNRLERLTPLELEVSLAAAGGASLNDVAHGLFLGPRTARLVHVSAMAKLGVESTEELAAALGSERSPDAEIDSHATV
jgi:DNA-binding NarL/FixJ family response regulator